MLLDICRLLEGMHYCPTHAISKEMSLRGEEFLFKEKQILHTDKSFKT